MKQLAASTLPAGYALDYASESRQFVQQGSTLVVTFVLSILLVYLLLAAQFRELSRPAHRAGGGADVGVRRARVPAFSARRR